MKRGVCAFAATLSLGVAVCACGPDQGPAPTRRAAALRPAVAGWDPARLQPSFVWLPASLGDDLAATAGAAVSDVAWDALRRLAPTYRLSPAALEAAHLHRLHDTGHGAVVAHFRQRLQGVPVFGSEFSLLLSPAPVAAAGALAASVRLADADSGVASGFTGGLTPAAAVAAAARALSAGALPAGALLDVRGLGPAPGGFDTFTFAKVAAGAASLQLASPVRVRPVWYPAPAGLASAYYVEIDLGEAGSTDSAPQALVIAAQGGAELWRKDLTAADSFTYRVWADSSGGYTPWDSPQGTAFTPHPTGTPDGTDPAYQAARLVTLPNVPFQKNDPWLPATATDTRGNNALAYADLVAPDGYGAGDVLPTTTAARTFDWGYDPATAPQGSLASQQAVTTQLFYVVNYLHDVFYDAGWTEAAGNPQKDNFGRGGVAGDPIKAEAQDYSGKNNANASTPADGASPRIQMYLWDSKNGTSLSINRPVDISRALKFTPASFGPRTYDVTADAALVDDGSAAPTLGCAALRNAGALAGKIALFDRGTCPFVQKADNAQKAGAVAALIFNNAAGLPPDPLGTAANAPTINIPTQGVSQEDGGRIKALLLAGLAVNLSLKSDPIDRDGSLDTTIVAHEWGHILSNRLIGDGSGLLNQQGGGLGEGWSDFVSLLTVVRAEDARARPAWDGVYAEGAFAIQAPGYDAHYYGIRRYPYSTDFSKNPLTFQHIADGIALPATPAPAFGADGAANSEVHNTGEVWATMLWECYAALLRDPRYTFPQASARMREYLVVALQLTPRLPTLLEARDALLSAARARDEADWRLFAAAFARRGAGAGATGPVRTAPDNAPVVESYAVGGELLLVSAVLDDSVTTCDRDGVLDAGESGRLTLTIRASGAGDLAGPTAQVQSAAPGLLIGNGGAVKFPRIAAGGEGQATLDVALQRGSGVVSLPLTVTLTDANQAAPRAIPQAVTLAANYDEVAQSAAVDRFDTLSPVWSAGGDGRLDGTVRWERVARDGAWPWVIAANPAPSDQSLVSPELQVTGALGVTLQHHYQFESAAGQNLDGGVVEVSADGGATWQPVDKTAFGAAGLGGAVAASNPVLGGRDAFVGTSAGYPADVTTAIDLGTRYQGQAVRIRLRVGTGAGGSSAGWSVSQVAVTGLQNLPFPARQPNRLRCADRAPVASAGAAQRVAPGAQVALMGSGTDPDGDPLTFRWVQTGGALAQLSRDTDPQATFVAPAVVEVTELGFQLVANDGVVDSAPAAVKITVDPALKGGAGSGGGCRVAGGARAGDLGAVGRWLLLGGAGLLWRRRGRRGPVRFSARAGPGPASPGGSPAARP